MPITNIDKELCRKNCGKCVDACPVDVLRLGEDGKACIVYGGDCNSCLWCLMDCPTKAIKVSSEISWPWLGAFYP